jgi:hypothetical protein
MSLINTDIILMRTIKEDAVDLSEYLDFDDTYRLIGSVTFYISCLLGSNMSARAKAGADT